MKKEVILSNLKLNEEAFIKNIKLDKKIKNRLNDLGFTKKTKIKCILKSPLNEPKAYLIKGAIISLRKDVTKNIICEMEEH